MIINMTILVTRARLNAKPRIVLKSAFNPSGDALKKSNMIPETNPVLSANNEPLFKATNNVIISKKSGIAGKNVKFEITAVSRMRKQNIVKIVEKKDFNITYSCSVFISTIITFSNLAKSIIGEISIINELS